MATKKSKAKKEVVDDLAPFVPQYGEILARVERKFKLTQSTTDVEARRGSYLSTGLLATDLILGGGFVSGSWCTVYGGEQSAKSTLCMQVTIAAVEQKIPLIVSMDFEGSQDPNYYASTLDSMTGGRITSEDIFGVVDKSTGEVLKTPLVHLYTESVGEQFFDSMAALLRDMPDKQYMDDQWWYIYENTVPNRKIVDGRYDKALFSEYNKFFVPAENGKPQALLLVDSYPFMFPEKLDEDDKGAGLAAVARMFSENIPKLAPKLKKKGVVVLGVNQLRLQPMARGNPEYEPAGQTIKFVSSVRVKQSSRVPPHGEGHKGGIEIEDSVFGSDASVDEYRYLVQKATKNKTGGIPQAEVWQRIWIADFEGKAHGIDIVWDTFQYLKLTGQFSGTMKKMNISIPGFEIQKLSWFDFKGLLLMQGKDLKELCASLGITKNPKIRETCRKQMDSGKGYPMYIDHVRGNGGASEEEAE
jgi:RecA/RadA recombinase